MSANLIYSDPVLYTLACLIIAICGLGFYVNFRNQIRWKNSGKNYPLRIIGPLVYSAVLGSVMYILAA